MAEKPQIQAIMHASELATFLKQRRKALGVTQQQLANVANLSNNGISQIELGNKDIKLSTLLKFSRLLGFKIVLEVQE